MEIIHNADDDSDIGTAVGLRTQEKASTERKKTCRISCNRSL